MERVRLLIGAAIGYMPSALFNAILVVAKETNPALKGWLKTAFGHHWIGHGVLTLLVFIIATLIAIALYRGSEFTDKLSLRLTIAIIIITLASALIIAGFYLSAL